MLDGAQYSAWQVLDSANAYYELSAVFTSRLPATLNEPIERGDLAAASATNRILALELYLKAMLIGLEAQIPQEHDLKILFDALPVRNQEEIKHYFDIRCQALPQNNIPWELCIFFGIGSTLLDDASLDKVEDRRVRSDHSLDGLLIRNRGGFVASRYLFEKAKPNHISMFNYEHRRLGILCSVLCEGLENGLPQRQVKYKRHFGF